MIKSYIYHALRKATVSQAFNLINSSQWKQAVLIRNNIMYVIWHSTKLFIGLPEKDLMTPSIISPISTIPIF